jgi:hypothetical protein
MHNDLLNIFCWFKNHLAIVVSVIFIALVIFSFFFPRPPLYVVTAASLGSIFAALKYQLDKSAYKKSLFKMRYKIFSKIDEILRDCFRGKSEDGQKIDWRTCTDKLDSIYRQVYFLFNDQTGRFLGEFRQAVIDLKYYEEKHDFNSEKYIKAHEFLSGLLNGQNLSKKFPELKIDSY